ncbi:chitobiase/beta-hexosaminidase C-terminal domain-containing protein [Cloacibacillus sp. An23]|uniref:chitobiase/beta-hexosaminidase C-terminal domain-containing protein n=1 Tax=Cloacibacillus sp. An23 TaxID=1965591 RepID=UPI000B380019|nr:chitobiase/beta-hexosaminidase C-terminal domain-containing protein [Cloacibacillus sp. An23]OUO93580.1 hypothetical protein B5F39_07035 [Cloacibacillus sp. An23]
MKVLKRKLALVLALIAVLAMCGSALAQDGYVIINGTKYEQEAMIDALNPGSGIVTDNSVIEVYGEVNIRLSRMGGEHGLSGQDAFLVISADNVSVEGKTDDALLYPSEAVANGAWGTQNFITVFGSNVTIKDVAIMPKFDVDGDTNKTVEVCGEGFTMVNCTLTPNTKYSDASGTITSTADGGSLCISEGTNATITGTTFVKACVFANDPTEADVVTISGCTFDTPAEDTYFIGNTTWATPPSTDMGTMNVTDCKFINVPLGYDKVILHRMDGTFNLERNTVTLADGTAASLKDMIAFDSLERNGEIIEPTAEGAVVKLTEDGHVYSITPKKSDDGAYTPVSEDVTPDVAAPVATPAGGEYTEAQTVTLTAEDETAAIYYTTDGTDPTEASTLYSGAITIDNTTTLKAIAAVNGAYSAPLTEVYTITTGGPTSPDVPEEPTSPDIPPSSGGSGGGCSAGFGALALLAAVPMLFRRKK